MKFLRTLLLLTMMIIVGTVFAQEPASVALVGLPEEAALTFNEAHQLWLGEVALTAGDYEYSASLDDGTSVPAVAPLSLASDTTVTVIYNHDTGYLADNVNRIFANVPGNFNSEVGCGDTSFDDPANVGDWAPDCWQTLLEDPDGDGIYTFATTALPAGSYEGKVAVGGSWAENYGEGGAPGGANMGFTVAKDNAMITFNWNSDTKVTTIESEGAPKGNLSELGAYWVSDNKILVPEDAENTFTLHYSEDGSLQVTETGVMGGTAYPLIVTDRLPDEALQKFPHLSQLTRLQIPLEALSNIHELVRGQLVVSVSDAAGNPVTATGVQLAGVIDELYTYDGELGVTFAEDRTPTFRLWAPTAQAVRIQISADPTTLSSVTNEVAARGVDMVRDKFTGTWTHTADAQSYGSYYIYEVDVYVPSEMAVVTNYVTDPYSHSLSTNSTHSQIIDLNDPNLAPAGWEAVQKPALEAFEDIVLYELHVRDFSIRDESVPEAERGTFKAFTHANSAGMQHLTTIADAGVSHLHLLPVFDIATINENKDEQRAPLQHYLEGFPADSDQQQQAIDGLRDEDGFNWGYDPYHYTVPEGSYSTDPNGTTRIVEFREMVQSVNENAGMRLVMDVVYNHTNSSGQSEKSVLDKIVPNYYHRLNSRGKVESSTCCANTATEHNMMHKLMVDSIVTWATQYKVDGFRFDLMGHHMVEDMRAVREALDALTMEEHGVNGAAIYVYGEGWDFGEVQGGQRGANATQTRVGGLGIGTFNDRIRDGARGGNPFGGWQEQGFATGLLTNPNAVADSPAVMENNLTKFADWIRVGLTGNLADYVLVDRKGNMVTGREVDYNGAPVGYTTDPQEVINYVSAHDNETLFDAIQYKVPVEMSTADRARTQMFALDLVMLGQGIPFFHAGSDLLRSKSMDRDSYNSGDWFNGIDWTYQSNNWAIGLPIADKNESNWNIIAPLLANESIAPTPEDIAATRDHFRLMAQVRQTSPLFRLRTAQEVQNRLTFHNTGAEQLPGLIVMSLSDDGDVRIDPNYNKIVILFNGRSEDVTFTVEELAGVEMGLHPLLATSSRDTWLNAQYNAGTFTVPALTTTIFVQVGDANTVLEPEFGMVAAAEELAVEETEDSAETTPTTNVTSEENSSIDTGTLIALITAFAVVLLVPIVILLMIGIVGLWALLQGDDD